MVVGGISFEPNLAVKAQPVQQRADAIEYQNHLVFRVPAIDSKTKALFRGAERITTSTGGNAGLVTKGKLVVLPESTVVTATSSGSLKTGAVAPIGRSPERSVRDDESASWSVDMWRMSVSSSWSYKLTET
jgi:hypothetical protein